MRRRGVKFLTELFNKWRSLFQKWQLRALIALALVCLVLLFVGGPQRYDQRSYECAWGLGHVLCFAVWSLLFLRWKSRWTFARQFFTVIGLTCLLGVGIELVQAGIGRNFDTADVLNNLAGSLLVLAFFCHARLGLSRSRRLLLQIVALLLLSVGLYPLGRALLDERRAAAQFPVLSDFESSLELGRWEGNAHLSISRDFASHGKSSLRAELNTDHYSGPFLRFFPRDWRAFKSVTFDLYNPQSDELKVTCRVHDLQHSASGKVYSDRFNRTLSLPAGWTQVEIPLEEIARAPQGRLLDLGNVAGLGLFVADQELPKTLYLDHLRLRR